MAYLATPLESSVSPAEFLMGRKIHTTVPILPSQLEPRWPYLEQFRGKDPALKAKGILIENTMLRASQTSHQKTLPGYPAG